jgi:hypothetical protein
MSLVVAISGNLGAPTVGFATSKIWRTRAISGSRLAAKSSLPACALALSRPYLELALGNRLLMIF